MWHRFFFHCTGELNAKELYTFTEQKITSYIYLLIYYLHFFREVFLSIFLSALRKLLTQYYFYLKELYMYIIK